ncbi:uncharacterized protein LOC127780065 [Oryza glaberrima]|nr:uncharacterized protein LOC127780065 [Oryza glaberrima]
MWAPPFPSSRNFEFHTPRLKPAMPPAAASPGGGRRRGTAGEAPRSEKRPRESQGLESESGSDGGSGSDSDGDFVSDLREIVCLLRLIKGGVDREGQKMCEQIIASVAADIQTMLEDTKLKFEKQRQNLLKVLSNTSKEQCDNSLSKEFIKFQESYEIFCKEKDVHVQAFRDLFSKVEVEKKALLEQFENHRKEETATLSELDNTFSEKITRAEQSLRKTEVDNTFSAKITHAEQYLRRTQFNNMFSGKKTHEEQSLRRKEFDNTFSEKVTHAEPLRRMKQDDKSFIILRKSVGSFLEFGSDDDFDLDDD